MAGKKKYSVELVLRAKDWVSATFQKIGRGLKWVGGKIKGLVATAVQRGQAIGGFVSAVGSGLARVGGFLADLAVSASDVGSAFNDLNARTGIAPRVLQEVAYAADQAGVPLSELSAGLLRMSATIGKGLKTGQLRMLGRDAGRFVATLKGKGPTEQFEAVLSMMAQIPDASKRAAFAQVFFGRSGIKLAAIAGDGAEALAKMRHEAAELGLVMSDDAIKNADEFGDTWASLGKVWASLKNDFGSGLIEGLLPGMRDLLQYVKDNRKEVGAFVRELGRKIGSGVGDLVQGIVNGLRWIVDNQGLVVAAAAAMGLAFVASLGPIPAAIAAITAAIGGVIAALNEWAEMTPGERKESTADAMTINPAHELLVDKLAGKGTFGWWNANMDEMKREGTAEVATEKAMGALIQSTVLQNNMRGAAGVAASASDSRRAGALWALRAHRPSTDGLQQPRSAVSADFGRYAYKVTGRDASERAGGLGALQIDVNLNPKGDFNALFATPTATVSKSPPNTQTKVNTGKRATSHAKGG